MGLVLLVVSLIMFNVLVTSILYHRSLTHRSVTFNRWLARAMTVYMQGMAFAPPLTWVATHRLHHSDTDTARDPYSPRVHGFLAVLVGTPVLVSLWRRRHGRARVDRLTRGMPDAAFYAFCEWRPFCFAITGAFVAGFVLAFGGLGVPLFLCQAVGFYLVIGWQNSAGHTFGERPFAGSATNHRAGWLVSVVNVCLWGEYLHNNHHRFPTRANFGLAGELDAGYLVCRALARLGLCSMRTT
jgi:fatty-acid desaturase